MPKKKTEAKKPKQEQVVEAPKPVAPKAAPKVEKTLEYLCDSDKEIARVEALLDALKAKYDRQPGTGRIEVVIK